MSGESLERYFRMIRDDRQSRPSGRLWCPAADVYRSKDGWIVKVDLAGIKPADVDVTLDNDVLRISGSRRDGTCGEGVSILRARRRPCRHVVTDLLRAFAAT